MLSVKGRLFEVIQAVKEINQKRFNTAFRKGVLPKDEKGKYQFSSESFDANALADEMKYRELLWRHTPLTDFWGFGAGTANRVAVLGCHTMGDIARLSTIDEDALYKMLGVKAEIVIDQSLHGLFFS